MIDGISSNTRVDGGNFCAMRLQKNHVTLETKLLARRTYNLGCISDIQNDKHRIVFFSILKKKASTVSISVGQVRGVNQLVKPWWHLVQVRTTRPSLFHTKSNDNRRLGLYHIYLRKTMTYHGVSVPETDTLRTYLAVSLTKKGTGFHFNQYQFP